ncbi:IS4 family transposase [Leadbetterella sp. DM7]|uniref:IS4 family transposase n=1 Tax=Leadbetterella sp. DM7 TaxID=3235085 RepID=UPI00349EAD3F
MTLYDEQNNRHYFTDSKGFTRKRSLTFKDTVLFIARNMGKSYQRELNEFYQAVESEDFLIQKVTKGAFTQARAKLSHTIFKKLSQVTIDKFYQGRHQAWGNYRLLAVDGSTIELPKHKSITEEFGVHGFGPNADSFKSLARISLLYDVINCVTLDAQIDAYACSESELCYRHLEHVKEDDLVIFDRYYASFKLMWELTERKAAFCFRMKDHWFKEVELFQKESIKDKQVTFYYHGNPIPVRLVKIESEDGSTHILCCSIFKEECSLEDLRELYGARWGVETHYRTLKNWLELENFSGKTSHAVRQDFYAKVFIMNLCAALTYPVSKQIEKEKALYQVNRVDALSATKHLLIPCLYHQKTENSLKQFDKIVAKAVNKVRPSRKYIRKKKPRAKFSMVYKNL